MNTQKFFLKEYESCGVWPFHWLQHHEMLTSITPIYNGKGVINDSVTLSAKVRNVFSDPEQ